MMARIIRDYMEITSLSGLSYIKGISSLFDVCAVYISVCVCISHDDDRNKKSRGFHSSPSLPQHLKVFHTLSHNGYISYYLVPHYLFVTPRWMVIAQF
jgi:hypothetical protein